MSMSADVAGGGGEGVASPHYLWWPPHKISPRYLASLLHYGDVHAEPEPPGVPRCGGRPSPGMARGADGTRPDEPPLVD